MWLLHETLPIPGPLKSLTPRDFPQDLDVAEEAVVATVMKQLLEGLAVRKGVVLSLWFVYMTYPPMVF